MLSALRCEVLLAIRIDSGWHTWHCGVNTFVDGVLFRCNPPTALVHAGMGV